VIRILLLVILVYFAVRLFRSVGETRKEHSPPANPPKSARSPHDVLGIAPNASAEEIRAAYQTLVQKYHPDRVADMGREVREVAEQKTKEINAAYAALKRN
jgi:DnaJ like chaperone protein